MRISTANAFDSGISNLVNRQADLSAAQEQLTSGLRVEKASDDPAAAARAEHALAVQLRSDTTQRSVNASKDAVSQTESQLGNAGDLLQQARQLLVAAGNATYTDAERQTVAGQLQSIRAQLLAVANTSNISGGGYLFAGQGATQQPFVDAPGGVKFVAVGGQLNTGAATALPLTTDGSAAWMSASTGNGVFVTSAGPSVTGATIDGGQVSDPSQLTGAAYTLQFGVAAGVTTYAVLKNGAPTAVTAAPYVSGQAINIDGMTVTVSGTPASGDQFQIAPSTPTSSVFDALDKAIAALSTPGRTGSQIAQTNAESLSNVDAVMGKLQAARATAGAVLNQIDNVTNNLSAQKVTAKTTQSDAIDLDMVQALSSVQAMQTGYSAALQSYAMVQKLSLFQYLGA